MKLESVTDIYLASDNTLALGDSLKLLVWIDDEIEKELEAMAKKVFIFDEHYKMEENFKNNQEVDDFLNQLEIKYLINGSGKQFYKFQDLQNGADYTAISKFYELSKIHNLERFHRNMVDCNILRFFSTFLKENIKNNVNNEMENNIAEYGVFFKSENFDILLERKYSIVTLIQEKVRSYESTHQPKRIVSAVYCPAIADDVKEKKRSSDVIVLTDQLLFNQ